MMRRLLASEFGRAKLLLLTVSVGIVIGIVGMHGPTDGLAATEGLHHGVSPVAGLLDPPSPVPAFEPSTAGHHQGDESPAGVQDHCGMIALCLAALVGGVLLLVGVIAASRRNPMSHLKRASAVVLTHLRLVFRAPPDLISLSILRC